MRILLVNSHHKIIGGAERYFFDLADLLIFKGHKVAFFSMVDKGNKKTKWRKYFIKNINYEKAGIKNLFYKLSRMFYSLEAKRKISKLLDDFKPDIVHIGNIYYYISPSILDEIKKRNIPIVQTVNDYQLISPNINLFFNGKVCEITKKHRYYKAFFARSVKRHYIASLMATFEAYIKYIFRFYENNVSIFFAPSRFMKNKIVEYGFKSSKVVHLPYFTRFSGKQNVFNKTSEKYILYSGRIVEEKGILFMLDLARSLPLINFKIVGKFSHSDFEKKVRTIIKINSIKNIKILGYRESGQLRDIVSKSYFVFVPSIWYETFCIAILEAYSFCKPVLASRIGGIPEVVVNGKTGLLFNTGDVEDCKRKILKLWNNPSLVKTMGKYSKRYVDQNFGPDVHYTQLMKIYNKLVKK